MLLGAALLIDIVVLAAYLAATGVNIRADDPATRPAEFSANGDPTELRLLLSLRYRIRVDLGLAEDDYDRLLDELPSDPPATGPPTPAADS